MNLFGTVLTYTAPSANYRGESPVNRAEIQKITKGRFEYPIISPEAMRNALRETIKALGLPCNRTRLGDEEQLAVAFLDYPDEDRFADDFFMGWLVAASGNDRKAIRKELQDRGRDPEAFTFKRDSISAAYGLLLNLAGIEMRRDDGKSPMTLIEKKLSKFEIALGALAEPQQHSLYQQIHNYPVGKSGAAHASTCKGNKYKIVPTRRAFLSGLKVCLGIRADTELETKIVCGLRGEVEGRYGLPFLGDNNFLPDRIDVLDRPHEARWLVPVGEDEAATESLEPMRLTVTIDRADMSRTVARLFRLDGEETTRIPAGAWVEVAYG